MMTISRNNRGIPARATESLSLAAAFLRTVETHDQIIDRELRELGARLEAIAKRIGPRGVFAGDRAPLRQVWGERSIARSSEAAQPA